MESHALYAAAAVLAFLTFLICREAWNKWKQYQAIKHLPGPQINSLLGMFSLMVKNQNHHRLLASYAETYGGIYSVRFAFYWVVVITDPIVAARVLKSDKIDKWDFIMAPLTEWLGGHNLLTSSTNAQWRAIRKAIAPAFSPSMLRNAAPGIAGIAGRLAGAMDDMPDNSTVDVEKLLLMMTLDILGNFAFDQDLENVQKFHEAVKRKSQDPLSGTLAELLLRCTKLVDKNFRIAGWRFRFWRPDVHASWKAFRQWREVLQQILKVDDKNSSSDGSILALLRKARDVKTGKSISRKSILAEMAILLFAGSDTTAHQLAWILYLVSQHKDVEAKLVDELQLLHQSEPDLQRGARGIVYNDLSKLPYLQAVIKETMRMMPSVGPGQTWDVKKTLRITEDLEVPPGVIISVPHFAMFTSARNWEQSHEFIPERWLEPGQEFYTPEQLGSAQPGKEGKNKMPKSSQESQKVPDEAGIRAQLDTDSTRRAKRWMPFGDGQRDCAGKELAKIVMPIALATLLMKYSFSLAAEMGGPEGVMAVEETTLVTGTKNGLFMDLHRRPKFECT